MAIINPPSYVQDGSHAAIHDRMTQGALTMPSGSSVSARGGVRGSLSGTGMKVIARTTPTAGVTVKAGVVCVPDAFGGIYTCHLTTDALVTIGPASSTQNRIDLVVARVYDQEAGDGGSSRWAPEVIQGTPSSGAGTVPATPERCWPLAQIAVHASSGATAIAAGNITDVRGNGLTAIGGLMPVVSTAMPSTPHLWMAVYCKDVDEIRVWTGTKWSRYLPGGLPAPVFAGTNTNVDIPSGDLGWRYLPNRVAVDLALARPTLVAITISALMRVIAPSYGTLLIGCRGSGANVFAEETIPGRNLGDSGSLRCASYTANPSQAHGSITHWAQLQAGTTHVELRLSAVGSTTNRSIFGASLTMTPIRVL